MTDPAAPTPDLTAPLADVADSDLVWLVGYLGTVAVDAPLPPHLAPAVDACRRTYDHAAYLASTAPITEVTRWPLTEYQRRTLDALVVAAGPAGQEVWVRTRDVAQGSGVDHYTCGQALQALRRKGLAVELFRFDPDAGRQLLHWRPTAEGRNWTGPATAPDATEG